MYKILSLKLFLYCNIIYVYSLKFKPNLFNDDEPRLHSPLECLVEWLGFKILKERNYPCAAVSDEKLLEYTLFTAKM